MFTDIDGQVPDIIGVRVTDSVADSAFTASDVTFDADNIFVDLNDVQVRAGDRIIVDVNFAVPVAEDDDAGTAFATPTVIDVLTNDSDSDGTLDPTTVAVTGQGTKGTATVNPDGTITYTPDGVQSGEDSFTYTVKDNIGATSNEATVTVTIAPNQPPTTANDSYVVAEDNILDVTAADGVLHNDADPENQPLTANLVAGPDHGDLTLNADGSFTYTPDPDYFGTDYFFYTANDGVADSTGITSVELTVNPVNDPPAATDDGYSTAEDTILTVTAADGVLDNDGDVENDPLAAILATGPAHGDLTLNADGSFTYTPDVDFFGTDSFTYTAFDGQAPSQPAIVTLTVTPVNDAPVAADDTAETTLLTAVAIPVLANDGDVDGTLDPTSVIVTGDPTNGTTTVNPDGTVTYTPNFLFIGEDSFTYTVDDNLGATANEATVAVTVGDELNIVTGTANADFRSATNGADLIQTLEGNDTVFARSGNDTVLGGPGRDSLFGDNGNDILFGGKDGDALSGGNGLDILVGGPGDDSLLGGGGLDTAIFAGDFADHRISGFGTLRTVEDLVGDGGRDGLTSVELLQFDDGVFDARNGQFTEGAFATPAVEALVTSPGFSTDPEPILAPVA
ncbi:MAG: Ig-like domain-containing protein [Geminicoccaceae bacterium]